MFRVVYFEHDNGKCDVGDWLEELEERAESDKDARVQLGQMRRQIKYLEVNGTRGPKKIVEHLDDGIWELRPGCNRVLLFHYEGAEMVLLHHFRKETNKTPPEEIAQAKREREMYRRQRGGQ